MDTLEVTVCLSCQSFTWVTTPFRVSLDSSKRGPLSTQHILKIHSRHVRVTDRVISGNAVVISFRDSVIFFLLLEL